MIPLSINADKFHLPSSWNELTPDQLLRVAQLMQANRTPGDYKLKVLLKITGLTVVEQKEVMVDGEAHFYLQNRNKKVYLISIEALREITDAIDFMFEVEKLSDPPTYILSSRLTRNIIGDIPTSSGNWTGPADHLTNLITEEYIRAEVSYYRFHETGKTEFADALLATLWRPYAENPSSIDNREPFDDGMVNKRMRQVSEIPAIYRNAVLLFYAGCRRALASKFRNSSSGSQSKSDKDIFLQFMRMVNGLADNDVTKHEQVRRAPLLDTMVTIDEIARQQKELEQKMKKHRK